jgi:hypothetical protein
MSNERNQEQYEEDEEQDFRNAGSRDGNSREPEKGCDNCYNEER